jgi:glycosyltransferase involved in cell wall biosynthesis
MKILQVHNFYQQAGGEDVAFAQECNLLRAHGHAVTQYSVHNDEIGKTGGIGVAARAIWNQNSYRQLRALIKKDSPDVIHAHNTFPLISPAICYAAEAERVPFIQTLHNYRSLCAGATLYREGHVCELCLQRSVPFQAVVHRCYRGSTMASGAVALLQTVHRVAGTWQSKVTKYIALTQFSRNKFIEGGLPAGKITIKPNFLYDPGAGVGGGRYALFVGRLAPEKGLDTLLAAWESLGGQIPLKIMGDGPLRSFVQERARTLPGVEVFGHRERPEIDQALKEAAFLVFPSEWYEGMPLTIIEALACGTPVLASAIGSLPELVIEGTNGLLFPPGDANALAGCVKKLMGEPEVLANLRKSARICYERNYTPEKNYDLLIGIYAGVLGSGVPLS